MNPHLNDVHPKVLVDMNPHLNDVHPQVPKNFTAKFGKKGREKKPAFSEDYFGPLASFQDTLPSGPRRSTLFGFENVSPQHQGRRRAELPRATGAVFAYCSFGTFCLERSWGHECWGGTQHIYGTFRWPCGAFCQGMLGLQLLANKWVVRIQPLKNIHF